MRWFARFVMVVALLAGAGSALATNDFTTPTGGTTISGASGVVTGTTVGTTGQVGEPATYGTNVLNTFWYSWTAPGNGSVTFETCSATLTTFDTTLQSFTGSAVNLLTLMATNDDTAGCAVSTNGGWGSRITHAVAAGAVYHVQIDGFNNQTGNYRLAWNFTGFTIAKSVSAASISTTGALTYTITVKNVGTAALTGNVLTDALTLNGSARTLTSGPTLSSGDSNSNSQLDTTETWIYTATYNVPQAGIDTGGAYSNTATFDSAQTNAYASNAATTTITQSPAITVVKAQVSGPNPVTAAGQVVGYTITVDNSGNLTLNGTTVNDTLLLGASSRTLTSGPTLSIGDTNSDNNIDVTETWVYTATYAVTQADMNQGGTFSNVATADTTQSLPFTSNIVTTPTTQTPSLTVAKSWTFQPLGGDANGNGTADPGDIIVYSFAAANNGNVTISNVGINDIFAGSGTAPVPDDEALTTDLAPLLDSTDMTSSNNVWSSLAPGDVVTFLANYTVVQADIDNQ